MANIAVRKETEGRPVPRATWEPRLEPWRMMRDLMGLDPFGEMAPFATQIATGFAPAFEIKETKEGYLFKADIPGVKDADLDVTLTGNRLTVSGKRDAEKQEQTDTFYAYERAYGQFSRSFTLPDGCDLNTLRADIDRGVLTLSIRKMEAVMPKKIAVHVPGQKS